MARRKSLDVELAEKKSELAAVQMEIAVARVSYEETVRAGAGEKAMKKAEEVIREWQQEARILQDEISVIHKLLNG